MEMPWRAHRPTTYPKFPFPHTYTTHTQVEAALCIVLDEERLPKRAGVLTPAAAFGEVLMDRLHANAKMEFRM